MSDVPLLKRERIDENGDLFFYKEYVVDALRKFRKILSSDEILCEEEDYFKYQNLDTDEYLLKRFDEVFGVLDYSQDDSKKEAKP